MPSDTTSYRKYIRSMSKSNMAQFKRSYLTFAGIEDMIKSRPSDDAVYDYIVSWVTDLKASPDKISVDLVHMKSYLEYRGLDTSLPDIGQSMNFPSACGGLHPFTIISFRRILREIPAPRARMYLALASSGMHISEAVRLRRKDLRTDLARMRAIIPAKSARNGKARTVFFSTEVSRHVNQYLRIMDDTDLVFGASRKPNMAIKMETNYLRRLLNYMGIGPDVNIGERDVITTDTFQKFFISQVSRYDPGLAMYFSGHDNYPARYDHLTDSQRLDRYMDIEPSILLHCETDREKYKRRERENEGVLDDLDMKNMELSRINRAMERELSRIDSAESGR